ELVSEERNRAREQLLHKLPTSELKRLGAKLDELAETLHSRAGAEDRREETASRWALDARLVHRAERLDHVMRDAGAVYLADRLHAVRIALKKLRYAVVLRDEIADRSGDDLRTLKRSDVVLGATYVVETTV